MATRTGCLFRDENPVVLVNGAGTGSGKERFTGHNKARAGQRKPLGDLSNAGKPIKHAGGKKPLHGSLKSGKQSEQLKAKKNLTVVTNDEAVNLETANNKASEKSQTGRRKALGDISNRVPVIKNKNCLKMMTPLTEEPLCPGEIADEQCLHNHKKCIESQFETTMDVHHFYRTVGLENDWNDHKPIDFELSAIVKLKSEIEDLELEAVPEELLEVQSLYAHHGSPAYFKTPKLPRYSTMSDNSAVNFKLIETPKLSKF